MCDRGIRHTRNEDAVALAAATEPGGRAVLVVCDGVSSSTDSDVASLAAARAARDVLAVSDPRGQGTAASRVAATAKALEAAVDAANEAVIANTSPGPGSPASCTFVAAVVDGRSSSWAGSVTAGPTGCRTWGSPGCSPSTTRLPRSRSPMACPRRRGERAAGPCDHPMAGHRRSGPHPRTASLDLAGPGSVMACSDGLWNYCSEPHDVAALVDETRQGVGRGAARLAGALVDWANAQGGKDNITVALAQVGSPRDTTTRSPPPHRVLSPGIQRGSPARWQRSQVTSTRTSSCPTGDRRPRHRHGQRSGAGEAGQSESGDAAEIVIVDTSGSMGDDKIRAVQHAAAAAWTGCSTECGVRSSQAATRRGWPFPPARSSPWCGWTSGPRAEAKAAVAMFKADGGTAMGTWLTLATRVFASVPGVAQKHAILLTDGINQHETPEELSAAIETARTSSRRLPGRGLRLAGG